MSRGLRHKGASKLVWGLLVLLMLGLGGFGVTNFGGGVRAIGSVGNREIGVNDYARALRGEMNALSAQFGQQIPFAQAQAFGLDQAVRGRLIGEAALDGEAERAGLSAGDAQVRDQILAARAFRGIDGKFDRAAYTMALKQQGLTETEFETQLRADAARAILQGAVAGGVSAPASYTGTVSRWQEEQRGFSWVTLTPDQLTAPVPPPNAEPLAAVHAPHPAPFTAPETRVISYVWLSPEMMLPQVQMDEAALRAEYDARIDEFVQPERRLVERLVFGSIEEAAAAKKRIEAGEITLEQLAQERGLTVADIDLGEVTRDQLGAAGEGVFALTEPGIAGPLPSDLGPALYGMNAILSAQTTSFEDARATLAQEAGMDRARRMVADRAAEFEDLLAGGATLEDMAKETPMQFGTVEVTAQGGPGIAGYTAFREKALAVTESDFPEIGELEDGGLFALRLDTVRAPSLRPLAEVRDQAVDLWTRAETGKRLLAEAEAIAAAPDFAKAAGERLMVVSVVAPLRRDGFVEGLPEGALETLFTLAPGQARAIAGDGVAHVVRLDTVGQPAADDAEAAQRRTALDTQVRQGIAQDTLELFTRALEAEAGITLNQTAINAVHAQMQ